jgi:hypothetical protein
MYELCMYELCMYVLCMYVSSMDPNQGAQKNKDPTNPDP